jgi:hypothetical protein
MSRFLAFSRESGDRPSRPGEPAGSESDPLLSFNAEEGGGEPERPEAEERPPVPKRTPALGEPLSPARQAPAAEPMVTLPESSAGGFSSRRAAIAGLVFFAAFAIVALVVALYRVPLQRPAAAAAPVTGTAAFDSLPAGAEVSIDGTPRGVTPLQLTLPPGQHTVELRSGETVRTLPLTIEAGSTVSQYVEFAAAPTTGRLEIVSEPSGAQVRVDGQLRGVTPLTIAAIAPGEHAIAVSSGDTTVRRQVTIAAGATANVTVSIAGAQHAAGWVAWRTPFEMEVFENGDFIGTTGVDRMMLPAGRHQLELVNQAYGFRSRITVAVQAGQTASPDVPIPNGSLSVNALPWAEVFINGRPAGTTPLGNVAVPIGSHEIVWRHPQLGERRQTVTVTAGAPARIGMDLTR